MTATTLLVSRAKDLDFQLISIRACYGCCRWCSHVLFTWTYIRRSLMAFLRLNPGLVNMDSQISLILINNIAFELHQPRTLMCSHMWMHQHLHQHLHRLRHAVHAHGVWPARHRGRAFRKPTAGQHSARVRHVGHGCFANDLALLSSRTTSRPRSACYSRWRQHGPLGQLRLV